MDGNTFDRNDLLQAFISAASKDEAETSSFVPDEQKYYAYLDDPGLTDEQKSQIIQVMWSMAITSVEICFGSHPVQLASGKPEDLLNELDQPVLDEVSYTHIKPDDDDDNAPEPS